MKSQKVFKRNTEELQSIFTFLKGSWADLDVTEKVQMELQLSIEELFMNMVRHNPDSANTDIELWIEKEDDTIKISLSDFEEVPFDLTNTKAIDFDAYFEEKKFGGLGIHLVKELMDDIKFQHSKGISTITLTKQL
jgi:serine/threonine-protein kinase RsbW